MVHTASLRDVASIVMGQSPPGESYNRSGDGVPLLNGPSEFGPVHPVPIQWTSAPTKLCAPGDILFCVRGATAGRLNIADREYCLGRGLAAIRGGLSLDTGFLARVLAAGYEFFQARGVGSTFINISSTELGSFTVPVLPIAEQRRIAAILDQADALRAKRRAVAGMLSALVDAVYREMFGSGSGATEGAPSQSFASVLGSPLRNGVSPSSGGPTTARVLTLAAVTGDSFEPSAWKLGTFQSPPPPSQSVDSRDFLICRGNGNRELVGKGSFPAESESDLTFPDTIIAARIDDERIDRAYLQHVWNSGVVRRQIASVARTTNGTFKVNQAMLERIALPAPPLPLQRRFSERIKVISALSTVNRAAQSAEDELFASLQHRAFSGRL